MNIAPRAAATSTPEQAPTRTGRLSFLTVRCPWSFGRRLTARISVLDPEADGHCQRADLIRVADLLRNLHSGERVANADADSDEPFELGSKSGQVGGASRENDLADPERAGLVLVVLERGDELAHKCLDCLAHGVHRLLRLISRQAIRERPVGQREGMLHGFDLRRCGIEGARNCDVERRAAPLQYAGELADPAVRDRKGRALVTN